MATLLVIGSGVPSYREYALRAAASRHDLLLIHDSPLGWQTPYVRDFVQAALRDQTAVLEAAHNLAARHTIHGIFTYDEPSVETTALVAQQLGLPFNSRECAQHCRDKMLMRQRWAEWDIPSAQSRLATTEAEALAAAEAIGYPVVIKPRAMAASIGVVRADTPAELVAGFAMSSAINHPVFTRTQQDVLVEEYLDGPEVSVESLVIDGNVHCVALTRKQVGAAPYFEEIGHVVATTELLPETKAIYELVQAAHRALGVTMGATHAEVRLTRSGPRMIELGLRLGGDLIPHLVNLATGVDMSALAADIAAGQHPSWEWTRHATAAIRFIAPSQPIQVHAVGLDASAAQLPWLDQVTWDVRPGDIVRLPPQRFVSRLGFIIVSGESIAQCQQRLDQVESLLQITATPVE